jgi:hypothetical protein
MKKSIILLAASIVTAVGLNAEFLHFSLDTTMVSGLRGMQSSTHYGLGLSTGFRLSEKSLFKWTFIFYPTGNRTGKSYAGESPPMNSYSENWESSLVSGQVSLIYRTRLFNKLFKDDRLVSFSLVGVSFFKHFSYERYRYSDGRTENETISNYRFHLEAGGGIKYPWSKKSGLFIEGRVMFYLTYITLPPAMRLSGGIYLGI